MTIAYRGASGHAPENTISAIHEAAVQKSTHIELDLQYSKDAQVIVIHDSTVNRTINGKGKVEDLNLAQLKNLDAGSWFSSNFRGGHESYF